MRSQDLEGSLARLEVSGISSSIPEESGIEFSSALYSPCNSPDEPVKQLLVDDCQLLTDAAVTNPCEDGETELRQRFSSPPAEFNPPIEGVPDEDQEPRGLGDPPPAVAVADDQYCWHVSGDLKDLRRNNQHNVMLMVAILLLLLLMTVVLFFEVNATTPLISSFRQLAPVKLVRHKYYLPLRNLLTTALW